MTTLDDAVAKDPTLGEDPDAIKLVALALNDPLIRIWPEITGHERAVAAVAVKVGELLDLMCRTDEGAFNAQLAVEALAAASNHLEAGLPDDVDLAEMQLAGHDVARNLRGRYEHFENLDVGDTVGMATIGGRDVEITKLGG